MIHPFRSQGMKAQLGKLVGPIFIETALVLMLGVVDTIMLSQHSDEAVAAVGVVNQLIHLAVLVFQVISFGTTVLCAFCFIDFSGNKSEGIAPCIEQLPFTVKYSFEFVSSFSFNPKSQEKKLNINNHKIKINLFFIYYPSTKSKLKFVHNSNRYMFHLQKFAKLHHQGNHLSVKLYSYQY